MKPVNLKLGRDLGDAATALLAKAREGYARDFDAVEQRDDSAHLSLSNLLRLAIARGIDSLRLLDGADVAEEMLEKGMRRGKPSAAELLRRSADDVATPPRKRARRRDTTTVRSASKAAKGAR